MVAIPLSIQIFLTDRATITMMIEFQCGNLSRSETEKNRSIECGHKIIVSDDRIGEMMRCPKCKQAVEITDRPVRQEGSPKPRSASSPAKPNSKRQTQNSANSDELQLAAPVARRPSSDLSQMEFAQTETAPTLHRDQRKKCVKCGAPVNKHNQCTKCKFVQPQFEKATKKLDEITVELAGFQLWFCKTVAPGFPIRVLEYGSYAAALILGGLFSVVAILGVGGFLGFLMLCFIGCCVATFICFVFKGHQLARNPRARLAWFQKPFWLAILWLARSGNWQNYDQQLAGRKIINCRGEGITDDKILELEDIKICQVLDLENTPITDKGIRQLYGMVNLRCLVLRKTRVTHDGVFRLQQTHPRLWIWY